jgi:hypothetical protein
VASGRLKWHLGRDDYEEDLREAIRLVPADPPSPARARVPEELAHHTLRPISVKIASVHVSNILSKLGVTSRGEAAATAHQLRLFDSIPPHDQRGSHRGRHQRTIGCGLSCLFS